MPVPAALRSPVHAARSGNSLPAVQIKAGFSEIRLNLLDHQYVSIIAIILKGNVSK